ncbi:U5 small nuclear ribonucleoprotein 40 kDa protein [Balamuthia mandrillaris]
MEGKRKFDTGQEAAAGSSEDGPSKELSLVVSKKARTDNQLSLPTKGKELSVSGSQPARRTSGLLAPIMLLTGHQAEVHTVKFDPKGKALASGSFDKRIFLWDVYGECENYAVLDGHKNAVLELHWSTDGDRLYSASADKTAASWDAEVCRRLRKFGEHNAFVNTCCPSRKEDPLLVTGCDEGMVKLWDTRVKRSQATFEHSYSITAVAFSEDAQQVFSASLNNKINVWDVRKQDVVYTLDDHNETITGISLSPDGSYLLTNCMDNFLRIFDIRPFVPGDRCLKFFSGIAHGFDHNLLKCNWSADGSKVSGGSADRLVHIWDTTSRKQLYMLPGHTGTVNEVAFHPNEPIIVSCSADKNIYLGEIEP